MLITLTYTGNLFATQKDPKQERPNKKAPHVHSIRKTFHAQLKRHWDNDPFLSTYEDTPEDFDLGIVERFQKALNDPSAKKTREKRLSEFIPDRHRVKEYRFLPLVRTEWGLQCELDIVFLRKNPPGSLLQAGDIDNRIKTLLDALRMAQNEQELKDNELPDDSEDPFYCLLEDDQLVSRLNIETDRLLEIEEQGQNDPSWAKLLIRASVRPIRTDIFNVAFVS